MNRSGRKVGNQKCSWRDCKYAKYSEPGPSLGCKKRQHSLTPRRGSPKAFIIPIEELTRWPWRCCADMHHYRRFHSRPGRAHTSGARSDDDKHTSHQQKKVGPTKGDRILCISAILHATTTTTWRRDIGACLHAYSSFSCCNVSPLPHAFHSLCWLLRAALACH
jgi:hypothetical protein